MVTRSDGGAVGDLKHPVLASQLVLLADAAQVAPVAVQREERTLPFELRGALSANSLRLDASGAVQVFIPGMQVPGLPSTRSAGTRAASSHARVLSYTGGFDNF